MMEIKDILSRYQDDLRHVEENLDKYYRSYIELIPEVTDYIINSGGKRLRPLLLMITSDLCGFTGERRYTLAAVMEFLHTASLLHDDVIDHAETRRGRTAANNIWGNPASVLVGDFLYSQAFKLMVEDGHPPIQKLLTSAAITMVEGETAQLIRSRDTDITEDEYLRIIEQKTAILISASCALGALLAKVSKKKVNALRTFGLKLGVAFQVTDDTLDYVATKEEFGKAIGMDLKEGKITLPLIRTLHNCSTDERTLIKETLDRNDLDGNHIRDITSLIEKYDGINYALTKAKGFIDEAKSALKPFDDSFPKDALMTISDYILKRRL
ncbi:MAG TPA: polyprenyl synthetase family protein [Deltaproteobacteria bacterium]|nr:polyprenyl synthetase family protein [Deltaproteobacteria bacterium]